MRKSTQIETKTKKSQEKNMVKKYTGLLPVAGEKPVVLILGSYPSLISLEKQQYYANTRNAFWPIMERLYGIDTSLVYEQRLQELKKNRIALWDVLATCKRKGSSDAEISEPVPNKIPKFLTENPTVSLLALNGITGAGRLFKRFFPELIKTCTYTNDDINNKINIIILPSTSPANARMNIEEKVLKWSVIVHRQNVQK